MKYNIFDAFMGEVTHTVEAPHAGAALDEYAKIGGYPNWEAAFNATDGSGGERAADIYVVPHPDSGMGDLIDVKNHT